MNQNLVLTPQTISTLKHILQCVADKDIDGLKKLPNVSFVYDLDKFVHFLGSYGEKFSYPPENFHQFIHLDRGNSSGDGIGVGLPIWSSGVDPTDVEIDIWIEDAANPQQIFVKGHRIP